MKILKSTFKFILFFILIYFGAKGIRYFTVTKSLSELKTQHFTVKYNGVYLSNATEIAEDLESNYERIRSALKDPDHDIITVYVHGSQTDFNIQTGLTEHANGTSRGPLEFHVLWTNWFTHIFPDNPTQTAVHEFTHCVQLNILIKQALASAKNINEELFNKTFEENFEKNYPRWFWEAISIYEAGEINFLEVKYAKHYNPSLESLNKGNQIYRIGYTVVEYIVATWGIEKLPELITSYFDTQKVLAINRSEFEGGWKDYLNKNY